MQIGARAHDFGKLPPEELAPKIAAYGFTGVQLALSKAIAGIDAGPGRLSPGLANHIGRIFQKNNLQIAVLGCYLNLTHPDPATRRKLLNQYQEHLRFARDFGCSIVGTETGSVNADYSFNPENHSEQSLQMVIEVIRELVAEAEKFGVFLCIEAVTRHIVSSPERMKQVLDAIPSNNLQVIFDPVNVLSEQNYHNQDEIIQQSFDLFGDKIVIIHAKDFIIKDGKMETVEAGRGLLNYELLLKLIKARKPFINVLLENAKEATAAESIKYLQDLY